jgi:hypothetical protein
MFFFYPDRKVEQRSSRIIQGLAVEDAQDLHDFFSRVYNEFSEKHTWVPWSRLKQSATRRVYRRARGSFDGIFPVYALCDRRRVPLTADQCEELNRQALALAERPASAIRSVIQEMLDADKSGGQHDLQISAFLREQSPYNGSRTKTSINAPQLCDQCGRALREVGFFLDACTIEDVKWSWMCPPCFFALGCGVGQGFGQLYLSEGSETFLILGQEHPTS